MQGEECDDPEGWVDRHGDGLYRYALLRLRSPELAADAVQETFLEAIRSRGNFAGRSSERTWLVGILKHKVADHFRRVGRAAVESPPPESELDERGHWRVGPRAWKGEPSREAESREFWEILTDCVAKLPPTLADAFLMREMDGMSADEVRAALGITPANLWARLHRSRSLLRQCLETHWFGDRTANHHAPTPAPRLAKGTLPP